MCPTELTSEETLFTLQFASRVRNISVGAAKKNVAEKNNEDLVKLLKIELKKELKGRKALEDAVGEFKKSEKKGVDKVNLQMEVCVPMFTYMNACIYDIICKQKHTDMYVYEYMYRLILLYMHEHIYVT